MLNIKSLPDSIERPVYLIALSGGVYPTFEAGEFVDVLWDATLEEFTIRKITAAQPTGIPYAIFTDTTGNSTLLNLHRQTVVKGDWYGETDQYEDALAGEANIPLTISGDVNGQGVWAKAVAGNRVYGQLRRGSALTPSGGGTIEVDYSPAYIMP